jgi:hypothetical protein
MHTGVSVSEGSIGLTWGRIKEAQLKGQMLPKGLQMEEQQKTARTIKHHDGVWQDVM